MGHRIGTTANTIKGSISKTRYQAANVLIDHAQPRQVWISGGNSLHDYHIITFNDQVREASINSEFQLLSATLKPPLPHYRPRHPPLLIMLPSPPLLHCGLPHLHPIPSCQQKQPHQNSVCRADLREVPSSLESQANPQLLPKTFEPLCTPANNPQLSDLVALDLVFFPHEEAGSVGAKFANLGLLILNIAGSIAFQYSIIKISTSISSSFLMPLVILITHNKLITICCLLPFWENSQQQHQDTQIITPNEIQLARFQIGQGFCFIFGKRPKE